MLSIQSASLQGISIVWSSPVWLLDWRWSRNSLRGKREEETHSYLIGILSAFVFNKEVLFVCILSLFLLFFSPLSALFFPNTLHWEWLPDDRPAPLLTLRGCKHVSIHKHWSMLILENDGFFEQCMFDIPVQCANGEFHSLHNCYAVS